MLAGIHTILTKSSHPTSATSQVHLPSRLERQCSKLPPCAWRGSSRRSLYSVPPFPDWSLLMDKCLEVPQPFRQEGDSTGFWGWLWDSIWAGEGLPVWTKWVFTNYVLRCLLFYITYNNMLTIIFHILNQTRTNWFDEDVNDTDLKRKMWGCVIMSRDLLDTLIVNYSWAIFHFMVFCSKQTYIDMAYYYMI